VQNTKVLIIVLKIRYVYKSKEKHDYLKWSFKSR